MTELAFHGINTSRQKAKSVTHVSGTKCHLCPRPHQQPKIGLERNDGAVFLRQGEGRHRTNQGNEQDNHALRHGGFAYSLNS
jgi:hypothetical protein